MRTIHGFEEKQKTLGVNKTLFHDENKPVMTTNKPAMGILDAIDYIKRAGTPKKKGGLSIMHTNVPKWRGGGLR